MIVALEVVYDHVGKCCKLALCYFIQINLYNFILPDHHLEIGNEAKSHVIETQEF